MIYQPFYFYFEQNNSFKFSIYSSRRRRKRAHSASVAVDSKLVEIPPIPVPLIMIDDIKQTDDSNRSLASLRVATKVEWKRLRNMYLTLQRQKYSEVKKLLQQNKHSDAKKKSTLPPSKVRPVTMKSKASSPPPKRICTRNINFYGANRDEHNANTYECSIINENKTENVDKKEVEPAEKKPITKDLQFEFEPGLIVKVNFDEPCTDITDFKAEMRQYKYVQYVDIKEGQTYAYVRVDTPRSAPILIKHCAPNRCQILAGESETKYWAKIAKDREQKLSKAVKVPKSRSRKMRNLIRNIAEINVVKSDDKTTVTHIRFDDE